MRARLLAAAAAVFLLLCHTPAWAQSDATITATLSSTTCPGSGCVQLGLGGRAGAAFSVTGTWVADLQTDVSTDGGVTWTRVAMYDIDNRVSRLYASDGAGSQYQFSLLSGVSHVRVRVDSYTSGSASVTLRATHASSVYATPIAKVGGPSPVDVQMVGATDEVGAATTLVVSNGGLVTRNIPSGTQDIAGTVDVSGVGGTVQVQVNGTVDTNTNLATIVGSAPLQGNGPTGNGSLRVTLANDSAMTLNADAANTTLQTNGNSSLTSIDNKTPNLGQHSMGQSQPVVIADNQTAVPVSGTVAVTGVATAANQTTGNSSLSSIDTKTPALGQALAAGSTPVVLTAAQLSTLTPLSSVTVSGTVTTTPPANASTNVAQLAGTTTDTNSGNKSAGTLRVVLATDQPALTNKLLVTPDSVALPANQSVNVSQMGGTATSMNTGVRDAGTQRVTIATNDSVPVTGTFWQATQPVSGTVTANAGTGTMAISAATLPLPTGGSTLAEQQTQTTALQLIDNLPNTQGSTTSGQSGALVLGAVTTAAPSYTTAQSSPLSLNTTGGLRTEIASALPAGTNNIGDVDVLTLPALPAGTNVIGHVIVDTTSTTAVTQATGTNLHAVIDSGSTTAATQATAANLNAQVQGAAASGASKAGNPVQVGAVFNTTQPTVTTGQAVEAQATARGGHIVATGTDTFNVTVNAALPTGANAIGSITNTAFTANAGTNLNTSALALDATLTGRTQKAQITDGTRDGTIKAASTAAAAADTSLVVGLSPNSPLPAGTAIIGALSANQSTNTAQVGGVAVAVGQGVASTGTLRVVQAQEITYGAGTTAMTATAAGTGPFFSICGSATTTVRVQRFRVSGNVATGAKYGDVVLKKTSTATSSGTATTLTQAPFDSNSAAGTATNVKFYTVLGTAGSSVGVVGTGILFLPITGTPALGQPPLDFAWRDTDSEAPTLRGTSQCLEANFGTTPATAPTLTVFVAWTEK